MKRQVCRNGAPCWTGALSTPWGWLGVAGRGVALVRVTLPVAGGKRAALARVGREVPRATPWGAPCREGIERLQAFLAGSGPAPACDLEGFPDFARTCWSWMARIPAGRVASYGALASWAGRPKGARAVGRAAAMNPLPLLVPCHRVVGGDGRLVGFSAAGGLALKRRLLLEEGVAFETAHPPRVSRASFLGERPRGPGFGSKGLFFAP